MSKTKAPSQSKTEPARPAHHANNFATLFQNPWPSAEPPAWSELISNPFPLGWYNDKFQTHPKAYRTNVVKPDWGVTTLHKTGVSKENCVIGTWLGHAGCLTEVPISEKQSIWLLFDPIFSMRAGPTQYTGPGRLKPTPCVISELPGVDAVFISHNHYDHLDLASIKAIITSFPKARYFVPLGNRVWLEASGVSKEKIYEVDWWQERKFEIQDFGYKSQGGSLKITCVPAQHNSGRGATDKNATLWSGWVAEYFSSDIRKSAIYHAGDTGYRRTVTSDAVCPAFKEIGEKLGPFDLSFIPIWRGGTLGFISTMGLRLSHHVIPAQYHGSPTDGVDIHLDVKSRNTIGIHFGTFIGSENEGYEAVVEFAEAKEERNVKDLVDGDTKSVDKGRAGTLDIGASLVVGLT